MIAKPFPDFGYEFHECCFIVKWNRSHPLTQPPASGFAQFFSLLSRRAQKNAEFREKFKRSSLQKFKGCGNFICQTG
jgi:hypothetical protein